MKFSYENFFRTPFKRRRKCSWISSKEYVIPNGVEWKDLSVLVRMNFGTPTTAASSAFSGFSFGGKPTSSVAGAPFSSGLTFGTAAPAQTSSADVGSQQVNPLTLGNALSSSATTSSADAGGFKGLGGTPQSGQGDAGKDSQTGVQAKDAQLPPEIRMTVEELKAHIAAQRQHRDEIMKISEMHIHKTSDRLAACHSKIIALSSAMSVLAAEVKRIKEEVRDELRNVDISQRTREIPSGLQYENEAPLEYFLRKLQQFDARFAECKEQTTDLEKYLANGMDTSLSERDYQNFLNRLHATLLKLAGEANILHQRVIKFKSEWDAEVGFGQPGNPFVVNPSYSVSHSSIYNAIPTGPMVLGPRVMVNSTPLLLSLSDWKNKLHGPPPVNSLVPGSVNFLAQQPGGLQQASSNAWTSSSGLFGASVENKPNFQLQLPPAGTKRGKR
ncbi:unnamed protein product [Notodromas monacha]|uniref:Nucleoporin p58/p45 n=1 Tax=Notodromas monacha TaxID=399045 RepID=A0A7R9BQJ4_9CRUS|nr:unnamed protein product [Notodromas monacha]CAG0918961.1 unnamed protein product [Notodromas monacha]